MEQRHGGGCVRIASSGGVGSSGGICAVVGSAAFDEAFFSRHRFDYVVAADAGFASLMRAGIRPDAVVGDLDSAAPELRQLLKDRTHHSPDQETNDLTKTMRYLHASYGPSAITLLGASGGREDHLLANLALLPTYAPLVEELVMLTDEGYFLLITEPSLVAVEPGQQLSVFDFYRQQLTFRGVRWPLEAHTLPELWNGSLNCATAPEVYLEAERPLLLYVANL